MKIISEINTYISAEMRACIVKHQAKYNNRIKLFAKRLLLNEF